MLYVDIAICLIIAALNALNVGFLAYLHENGRRISGVGVSILKLSAAIFLAFTLRVEIVPEFPLPVLIFFLAVLISALRRCWVLARLFQAKNGFHFHHSPN